MYACARFYSKQSVHCNDEFNIHQLKSKLDNIFILIASICSIYYILFERIASFFVHRNCIHQIYWHKWRIKLTIIPIVSHYLCKKWIWFAFKIVHNHWFYVHIIMQGIEMYVITLIWICRQISMFPTTLPSLFASHTYTQQRNDTRQMLYMPFGKQAVNEIRIDCF